MALREASNGPAVLERVYAGTGIQLIELSGPDEAAATFLAVRRWYGWGSGTILNLDIGGGSFELAMGADEHPELAVSVPLGAGRLTRDFLDADPPTAKSIKAVRKHIRSTLDVPVADFRRLGSPTIVAGTSKSFRSLARISGAAPQVNGPYVRRELLGGAFAVSPRSFRRLPELRDRLDSGRANVSDNWRHGTHAVTP